METQEEVQLEIPREPVTEYPDLATLTAIDPERVTIEGTWMQQNDSAALKAATQSMLHMPARLLHERAAALELQYSNVLGACSRYVPALNKA